MLILREWGVQWEWGEREEGSPCCCEKGKGRWSVRAHCPAAQTKCLFESVIFVCVPLALSLPANVEDVCPNIPSLEKLMEEIVELAESGIRYTQMPHVMEVILPMLCSYMSRWWEQGPENNPERADVCCTALNSEHMNTLLGNILKIIYNNLGIDEGAWMKRLAGKDGKGMYHLVPFCFQEDLKYRTLGFFYLSLY